MSDLTRPPPGNSADIAPYAPNGLSSAPASAAPTRFYRFLRGFVRATLTVFYRRIEVSGTKHVDPNVPALIASNHPNSIIDPLLVGVAEKRPISFCARDGLFKIPGFGSILRAAGAIPIARRQDHPQGEPADNTSAFAACREVLTRGGVIAIFPEGKTHGALRVEALRTGTARIALDAALVTDGTLGVQIIPVGLNYLVRHAFRSDVHVSFGQPIQVFEEFGALARVNEREAVRALTDRIQERLRELAIHVEQREDEKMIALVTSIMVDVRAEQGLDAGGQSPSERTALAQRVLDAYKWLAEENPEQKADLWDRLEQYTRERMQLGLGGETAALQHRGERRWAFVYGEHWRARLLFILLGAPIAGYGAVNSALPYTLMRFVLRVFRPVVHRVALFKLLVGLVVFGALWTLQAALVFMATGPSFALLYCLSLPPTAIFCLRYATETNFHRLNLRTLLVHLRARDRLRVLREERAALQAELAELRTRYLAYRDQRGEG